MEEYLADLYAPAVAALRPLAEPSPDRRDIAGRILAQQIPCKDHPMPLPRPSCWQCARNGAFHRAALIVLGEFQG